MRRRIYVVEDHPVFREALLQSLKKIDSVEVCGQSPTAENALENLPETKADIVLVDLSLPKMNGFEFAAEIKKRCPGLACVVISGYRNKAFVDRARYAGLQGYVVKGETAQLKTALNDVIAGKSYFPQFDQ